MTDTEKKELIKAAYIESCVCYPVVTYAMENAARLIDPASQPVTDQDFQDVYKCPFELIERERTAGRLRHVSADRAQRFRGVLADLAKTEKEDAESVRAIDPATDHVRSGLSKDMRLARYVTRQSAYEHWADLIESLADVEKR